MADNPPPARPSGPLPPLPSSGMTGRLPSPTTQLPSKKGGTGKIVVMLSSVAKPAPAGTQALPPVVAVSDSQGVRRPPPLPPKQVSPAAPEPSIEGRLSATTYVKLPPKTSVPALASLSGKPVIVSDGKSMPPPLPVKRSEPIPPMRHEPKKTGAQHIPPIKLNEPLPEESSPEESIFLNAPPSDSAPKPQGWKNLEPGEVKPPAGDLQSLEVFERSQSGSGQPTPGASPSEAKEKIGPLVAPPLLPPRRAESAAPVTATGQPPLNPPPLPLPHAKPESSVASPTALQVAPPLVEKAPELPAEKLPPPHLPAEVRKGEADTSETPGGPKDSMPNPSELPPLKPLPPQTPPPAKSGGKWLTKNWLKKQSTPLVVSSTSPLKGQVPVVAEAKLALKPAVLPKRLVPAPKEAEAEALPSTETAGPLEKAAAAASAAAVASAMPAPETTPPVPPTDTEAMTSGEKGIPTASVVSAKPAEEIPVVPTTKAPLPLTRAARAKKRRFVETVIFWTVLVPLAVLALVIGSLYFGRETRVEGQVIPPAGMTLNNEVWIVSDFRELASGIAEDLAAERTPLMQEIQERQDHVQRAQADVASREERIRLIGEEMQAAKDQITALVKQSRDATQQIWDGEGAQIDAEYQSHFNDLKKAIEDRAKSLNLNYQPDPNYPSPEVWANAYRLALYGVPATIDGVKEHQWLSDQMKQWRDFLKTLDDRKEQLREKAAQLKLAPAPQIADLNTKITELQQRSDGAAAEEVPLKAELQQAQMDLAQAQNTDATLDDKYYKQLDALPGEAITKHIPLATNGRFSWVEDDVFAEGEKEHHYWIFARATRADGRQYWALHHFSIGKDQTLEMIIEPGGFISTKAILRPNLSPDEQEQ